MKLKELLESYDEFDFSTKEGISNWLKEKGNRIGNYTIHDDLSVSFHSTVYWHWLDGITKLPFKIRDVNGTFELNDVPLTTLENFPDNANTIHLESLDIEDLTGITQTAERYIIKHCPNLKSLDGLPPHVEGLDQWAGVFIHNSGVESLSGSPSTINGDFVVIRCKLKSLKYGPREVTGEYDVEYNQLESLKHSPRAASQLLVGYNKITSLKGCTPGITVLNIEGNPISSLDGLPESLHNDGIVYAERTNISDEEIAKYPNGFFIKDHGMFVAEGWKEKAQVAGAAALMATALLVNRGPEEAPSDRAIAGKIDHSNISVEKPKLNNKSSVFSGSAKVLYDEAKKQGIRGAELIQLIAQSAHETANFGKLIEMGSKDYFKKYDPKHNPRKAEILGNTKVGDGEKFKGRGFLQLTGRDVYMRAGKALGLPLEEKPELLEDPKIGAKASIWFWKTRVQPKVKDFSDVEEVTQYINPGLKGLSDRQKKFREFSNLYNLETKKSK
jgi:putative chitinase